MVLANPMGYSYYVYLYFSIDSMYILQAGALCLYQKCVCVDATKSNTLTHKHAHTHAHAHTRTYKHTHTHTHTHAHTSRTGAAAMQRMQRPVALPKKGPPTRAEEGAAWAWMVKRRGGATRSLVCNVVQKWGKRGQGVVRLRLGQGQGI